ncbi:MAG: hypothetical protein Q4G64_01105 [bacterium]|nr:hypothetical protein [bacterium]
MRRVPAIMALAALAVAGCESAEPSIPHITPTAIDQGTTGESLQSQAPSPTPETHEPFPGYNDASGEGRVRLDRVERVVDAVEIYRGVVPEWGYPIPGSTYISHIDPHDAGYVSVTRLFSDDVIFEYTVPDDSRYVGTVVFIGDSAYINLVPDLSKIDSAEPTELLHINLTSGEVTPVAPPEGSIWNQWPDKLRGVDGQAVLMSNRDENWTQCVVAVPGGTSEAHEVRCFEGERFAFSTVSTHGVSILGFPADEDIQSCRKRYFVPLDGSEPRLIGNDQSCRPYDGLSLDGWDIWLQIPEDYAEFLAEGVLWANGPDGERFSLGPEMNGSMTTCGEYVYWRYPSVSREHGAFDAIYRWRPGDSEIELVYRTPDTYRGYEITCSEGQVGVHQLTVEEDPAQALSVILELPEDD